MTDNYIPQTSASDRYEAARKALARYDKNVQWFATLPEDEQDGENAEHRDDNAVYDATLLASALRAFITPPGVCETEEQIVARVLRATPPPMIDSDGHLCFDLPALASLGSALIRAGIQDAHECWEPEVALRPTQEQMLRWLGIETRTVYEAGEPPRLEILTQYIELEVD